MVSTFPLERRKDLIEAAKAFLVGRVFLGLEGFQLSHTHRALVASTAARMLHTAGPSAFDALRVVAFYPQGVPAGPGTRVAGRTTLRKNGHVHVAFCAWEMMKGVAFDRDGIDVIVHELAHVLDLVDGKFDGKPALHPEHDLSLWEAVRDNHLELVRRKRPDVLTVLRDYAGHDEAELFAVASECFFERPEELKATLPSLYRELSRFYGEPVALEP